MKPTDTQIGGTHYKDMPIQPIDFITKNNIPYIEGNIIKYLCRWKSKNGVEDLKKAKHYLEMLIDMEMSNVPSKSVDEIIEALKSHDTGLPKVEIDCNPETGSYWYEGRYDFTDLPRIDIGAPKAKKPAKMATKKK